MAEGADLVMGAVLMDNLIYADGSQRENIPGGAGLYALAGAALFSDDAVLVTGTGRDLTETFGPWMQANGLSPRGLRFADDHAPRNILRYLDEKTRTEVPVYGHDHFARIEPRPSDIAPFLDETRSLYVFRNADPAFWTPLAVLWAGRTRPTILWEIALDACSPDNLPAIMAVLAHVDALSINIEEARLILGQMGEEALIHALRRLGVGTVFLRAGARGSFVITPLGASFVPSLPLIPVDVTGGGNAYGGGALVGLARGENPLVCASMGTIAASRAIGQFGPPPCGTPQARAAARRDLDAILNSLEETL